MQLRIVTGERASGRAQAIRGYPTVCNFTLTVNCENLLLREILQQIPETQHDHLMCNNEYARSGTGVMQAHGVKHTAKPQYYVAPTLPAWRTMIKLSQSRTHLRLIRKLLGNSELGEPVKNTKLTFAQALIRQDLCLFVQSAHLCNAVNGLLRAHI